MTIHDDIPYVLHILEAIHNIEKSIKDCSQSEFAVNTDMKDANVRRIEIIGEAAKNISPSTKQKYADVNWKEIVGTRDKMIHHYFGVNYDIIWDILKRDIPKLKKTILKMKEEMVHD
ncbi:MAG TPA: DUF86 domain-containing protein [Candidatus Nanoarchaeia archaeon]|nr:DUF86 domain-containing protein [Candidatus Nanoarchaeia archaeon]